MSSPGEQLADQLAALGFFRYANPQRVAVLTAQFARKPSLWMRGLRRDYPADEERLAERNVKAFLHRLRPILAANGIRLRGVVETYEQGAYSIRVANVAYVLYTAEDLAATEQQGSFRIWNATTQRTFGLINQLLIEHGGDERIYSYAGWNDHWAVFLTEAQHALLQTSGLVAGASELRLYLSDTTLSSTDT